MKSKSRAKKSVRKQRLLRALKVLAVALVVLACFAAAGFYFFQGWRARDLASKALQSLEHSNYRAAWLQMNSARAMRPDDSAVLRASAIVETRFGMPSALDYWDRLEKQTTLSADDLEERGRAAAALGNDKQFTRAVEALDAAGNAAAAGRLRVARYMSRGSMDRAIAEAEQMVKTQDDTAMKLDLARLLVRRHVDRLAGPKNEQSSAIAHKITGIIDSLSGTPQEFDALALGLTFLQPSAEKRSAWVERAMGSLSASNPALLPAASVAIETGRNSAAQLYVLLRPVFDPASLDKRAAFAMWLARHKMPKDALTIITAQEAQETAAAFVARVEALAALGNWAAIIEASGAEGKAPKSMRFAAKARAEQALGYAQSASISASDAVRSALREGTAQPVIVAMDDSGAKAAVDNALVEMCGDPRLADSAFRVARDRFTRREPGGGALLAAARDRVVVAAPNSLSLQDYGRFRILVGELAMADSSAAAPGESKVTPDQTAKALAASPADAAARITHALALMRADRTKEVAGLFDEVTIYFNRLPPPLQAALSAVMAAGGPAGLGAEMARRVDADVLTPDERSVLKSATAG